MPHTPGPRCGGHRAPTRRVRLKRPNRPTPAPHIVALLLLAPTIGLFFGGAAFVLLCVGAATLAAARVRSAGLWWVLPAAPLAIWAVSVTWRLLDAPDAGGSSGTNEAVAVAHGMIDAFPAMILTVCVTALVAVVRHCSRRRSARV